ncbi:hypothetical protein [Butyrivibrio sp. NC2002]|uniref:hypothetical protein n=1 Tax=Butyrivibrio sp. NC2002 TaxID=1410610 RepID=UPI00055C514F|nr:hypothetical protein [Butyrivibrio sp. NC2002]
MKKKICALICCVVFTSITLVACGKTETINNEMKEKAEEAVKEMADDAFSEADSHENTSEKAVSEEPVEPVDELNNPDAELLKEGNTVTVGEICEITLDYTDITGDVMPKNPASFYTHYEADAGKAYVDVCVAYKNTDTSAITADDTMKGRLVYAGKYEYSGFSMIEEDNRGNFTYSNITSISPLSTEYIHYLFEVPDEVKNSGKEVDVYLTVSDKEYKVEVNQGSVDSSEVKATTEATNVGGTVNDGEAITTSNSEFSVDYSNITNDVMPKSPANFYSHYEADAGKVYVDFCIAYKNTSGSNIGADKIMSASLKYADKYDYTGFSMIEEDNRGDFTYSNITSVAPLSTEYIHYLFEVPEEVKNSSESIVISFTIDGCDFDYTVR